MFCFTILWYRKRGDHPQAENLIKFAYQFKYEGKKSNQMSTYVFGYVLEACIESWHFLRFKNCFRILLSYLQNNHWICKKNIVVSWQLRHLFVKKSINFEILILTIRIFLKILNIFLYNYFVFEKKN
jgi:hypothetical protein